MASLANEIGRLNFPGTRGVPACLLVTDERRAPDPLPHARLLPPGSGIVFRHYGLPAPARAACAGRLAALARERGLRLFVAGDLALARRVGAAGLHLAEHALGFPRPIRAAHAQGLVVTAAAHSWPAVVRAARAGVDAVLVSPAFATASHPGARPLGAPRLAWIAGHAPIAVFALGGIDAARARRLRPCGVAGVAALGAFAP